MQYLLIPPSTKEEEESHHRHRWDEKNAPKDVARLVCPGSGSVVGTRPPRWPSRERIRGSVNRTTNFKKGFGVAEDRDRDVLVCTTMARPTRESPSGFNGRQQEVPRSEVAYFAGAASEPKQTLRMNGVQASIMRCRTSSRVCLWASGLYFEHVCFLVYIGPERFLRSMEKFSASVSRRHSFVRSFVRSANPLTSTVNTTG